jgi:hypothetical protein
MLCEGLARARPDPRGLARRVLLASSLVCRLVLGVPGNPVFMPFGLDRSGVMQRAGIVFWSAACGHHIPDVYPPRYASL